MRNSTEFEMYQNSRPAAAFACANGGSAVMAAAGFDLRIEQASHGITRGKRAEWLLPQAGPSPATTVIGAPPS